MAASSLTSSQVTDELRLALARTREGCMCQVSPTVVQAAVGHLESLLKHDVIVTDGDWSGTLEEWRARK